MKALKSRNKFYCPSILILYLNREIIFLDDYYKYEPVMVCQKAGDDSIKLTSKGKEFEWKIDGNEKLFAGIIILYRRIWLTQEEWKQKEEKVEEILKEKRNLKKTLEEARQSRSRLADTKSSLNRQLPATSSLQEQLQAERQKIEDIKQKIEEDKKERKLWIKTLEHEKKVIESYEEDIQKEKTKMLAQQNKENCKLTMEEILPEDPPKSGLQKVIGQAEIHGKEVPVVEKKDIEISELTHKEKVQEEEEPKKKLKKEAKISTRMSQKKIIAKGRERRRRLNMENRGFPTLQMTKGEEDSQEDSAKGEGAPQRPPNKLADKSAAAAAAATQKQKQYRKLWKDQIKAYKNSRRRLAILTEADHGSEDIKEEVLPGQGEAGQNQSMPATDGEKQSEGDVWGAMKFVTVLGGAAAILSVLYLRVN